MVFRSRLNVLPNDTVTSSSGHITSKLRYALETTSYTLKTGSISSGSCPKFNGFFAMSLSVIPPNFIKIGPLVSSYPVNKQTDGRKWLHSPTFHRVITKMEQHLWCMAIKFRYLHFTAHLAHYLWYLTWMMWTLVRFLLWYIALSLTLPVSHYHSDYNLGQRDGQKFSKGWWGFNL